MALSNRVYFLVNLRDRLQCRNCGRLPQSAVGYHRGFEYHHIQPKHLGGSDEPNNMVLLCHACHLDQHQQGEQPFLLPAIPAKFPCMQCNAMLDPLTVEMNCGWYRCPHCHQTVHLFNHFFYQDSV